MIQVISLFSGCGGLDLGISKENSDLISSLEIDQDCCRTLELNKKKFFPTSKVLQADIQEVVKFSSRDLLMARDKKKPLMIIGGPPCQPFSKNGYWITNNKRLKDLDPRNHISSFFKVVEQTKADAFLLENVESILHPSNRHAAEGITEITKTLGFEPQLLKLNACEYGVPQKRKRVFFLGTRGKFKSTNIAPTHRDYSKKINQDFFDNLPNFLGVKDFIKEFSKEEFQEKEENCQEGTYYEELKMIPPGENYLHLTEKKGFKDPKFIYGTRFWNFLLKLHPDQPSWTIAATPGPWVGPFHWNNRRLRVPEIAAIQTFPKNYKFEGNRRSVQKQIGNAVPPKLAAKVLEHLQESLI